ncbi:MAG: M48 family metalloprotease [Thiohalomonadales bacterium]
MDITFKEQLTHLAIALFILSALNLSACATNPVTGNSDFMILSEQDEKEMGATEHPNILNQYGVYSQQKLQRYVNRIGQKLAANSHRSRLDYTFTVLDSPMVNAFALPGGYIYITRGMMAYLNSEAQLAAVLGHEIGHITARHGVRQYSAARATSIGSIIGSLFLPGGFSSVAQSLVDVLGSAIIQGYGRDYELQSDGLSAEYLAASGYNPESMIEVIVILKAQEEYEKQLAKEQNRKPNVYHGVFASHPENDERLQAVVLKTKTMEKYQQTITTSSFDKHKIDPYLLQINGLVYGDGEDKGRIYNNRFFQASLGVSLALPEGWNIKRTNKQLLMLSPKQDALLAVWVVNPSDNKTLQQQLSELFELKEKILKTNIMQTENGKTILTTRAKSESPFGVDENLLALVELNKKRFVFMGAVDDDDARNLYQAIFTDTMKSLRKILPEEQQYAKPLRIKIVNNNKKQNISSLAKILPLADHKEEQLRMLNGVYPKGNLNSLYEIKLIQ